MERTLICDDYLHTKTLRAAALAGVNAAAVAVFACLIAMCGLLSDGDGYRDAITAA